MLKDLTSWRYNNENFEVGDLVKVKSAQVLAEYVYSSDTIFKFVDVVGVVEEIGEGGMKVSGVENSRIFGCFEKVAENVLPDVDILSLIAD